MATNARIDDLRKRIEKDPGSRLFAQLAEELRKDGELEEAIRVAREGLKAHPNYPSARMTLGRALLDTGDWAAARTEFEVVLKGAPDNILASRYLAECHENLGERDAAIARYKATLAMAPGEKHVVARLQELEGGGAGGAARPPTPDRPGAASAPATPSVSVRPPSPPAPPPAAPAPPPPPIPLASVEGEMELETSRAFDQPSAAPAAETPMAPIPLVDVDEDFELERPYESPTTSVGTKEPERVTQAPPAPRPVPPPPPAAAAPPPAPRSVPEPEIEPDVEDEFELEAPHEAPSTAWAATIRPLPAIEEPPPPAAPRPASATPSTLISPTLGELYFNQGFTEKAIEVYRELSTREPANERLGARLRELEKLQGALSGSGSAAAGAATGDAAPATAAARAGDDTTAANRREAIERTIARLEGLLSAIRKG